MILERFSANTFWWPQHLVISNLIAGQTWSLARVNSQIAQNSPGPSTTSQGLLGNLSRVDQSAQIYALKLKHGILLVQTFFGSLWEILIFDLPHQAHSRNELEYDQELWNHAKPVRVLGHYLGDKLRLTFFDILSSIRVKANSFYQYGQQQC